MDTLTQQQVVAAGAVAGALAGMLMVFLLIFYVLTVIAAWKIFRKAGQPGWKSLIPIYNLYILYKIVGMTGWFWGGLCLSIVVSIICSLNNFSIYTMTDAELLSYDYVARPLVACAIVVDLIFSLLIQIVYAVRTSRAFGHGAGFAIGIFFLPNIFWLILGFGGSKYNKKKALR